MVDAFEQGARSTAPRVGPVDRLAHRRARASTRRSAWSSPRSGSAGPSTCERGAGPGSVRRRDRVAADVARRTRTCGRCGSAGPPPPVGTTSGRTSTSRCCARRAARRACTTTCWPACRCAAASVWRLPDDTWPDGRQSFVTLDPDPVRSTAPTRILDLHVHDDTPEARVVDARRARPAHPGRTTPTAVLEQRDDDEAELDRRRRPRSTRSGSARDVRAAGSCTARSPGSSRLRRPRSTCGSG